MPSIQKYRCVSYYAVACKASSVIAMSPISFFSQCEIFKNLSSWQTRSKCSGAWVSAWAWLALVLVSSALIWGNTRDKVHSFRHVYRNYAPLGKTYPHACPHTILYCVPSQTLHLYEEPVYFSSGFNRDIRASVHYLNSDVYYCDLRRIMPCYLGRAFTFGQLTNKKQFWERLHHN